ncbi:programmed cell death protein 4-like [Babylonia areolata]|uniref:programmed cell death protein 4-like n=1 Tax=Babylonia areolata TaxID=304850 RepID=UPI003FD4744E
MENGSENRIQDGVATDVTMNGEDELLELDDNPEADSLGEERQVMKAKRMLTRQSSGGDSSSNNNTQANKKLLVFSKNSRKSRDGRGRGLPKKGGAGGKGTWGRPGEVIAEEVKAVDSHDPNYDSDSLDDENLAFEKVCPEMTPEDFQKFIEPIVMEYFEHGDSCDVIEELSDVNFEHLKRGLVEFLVSKALDHKDHHRELTSILISDLYGKVLSGGDMMEGFDDVLSRLSDLVIDTPDATSVVGKFIARAVADDCLPPKFILKYKADHIDCQHTKKAVEQADILLNQNHGIVRLDNIWGTGGGTRPVKVLVKKIVLLLKEYLSSSDIAEATRCLTDLNVPHFHHEVVYEGTVIVLEDSHERAAEMMTKFFKSLADAVIITPEQFKQGFTRVYDSLPDICLDVPNAYQLMETFAAMCHKEGFMSEAVYRDLPQRGRKRFVSEGDGGKVKDTL